MIGIVFLTFLAYAAILVRLQRGGGTTARLELGCFIGVLIVTVGFIVAYSVYVF